MAYITQYQADMNQSQRDMQNQGAIAQGITNAVNWYQENRQRALAGKKQEEAEKYQKERQAEADKQVNFTRRYSLSKDGHSAEAINNLETTGDASAIYKRNAEMAEAARMKAQEDADLNRRVQESLINKNNMAANKEGGSSMLDKLTVPGFGQVKTKKEASEIRAALADANEAKSIIQQIKTLGTDIGPFDRERQGKIKQLKAVLAGKMRLPLLGPGTMTEDEFQRLVDNMGDPSAYLGLESNEKAKLDQLSGIIENSVKSKFNAAKAGDDTPQIAPQIPNHIIQKVQSMTPAQQEARMNELMSRMPQGGR